MVTHAMVAAAGLELCKRGNKGWDYQTVKAALEAAEAVAWQQGMDTAPTDAQQNGLILLAYEPFEAATCEAWKPDEEPWKPCKGREEFWKPPTHWRMIKPPAPERMITPAAPSATTCRAAD